MKCDVQISRFWCFLTATKNIDECIQGIPKFFFINSLPGGVRQSSVMSMPVRSHKSKTTRPNFTNFCSRCLRPFSDSVAVCYVLPVLWMTSCFHIMTLCGKHDKHSNQILLTEGHCELCTGSEVHDALLVLCESHGSIPQTSSPWPRPLD